MKTCRILGWKDRSPGLGKPTTAIFDAIEPQAPQHFRQGIGSSRRREFGRSVKHIGFSSMETPGRHAYS